MSMLQDPSTKYRRFGRIQSPQQSWPDAEINTPPVWCSVDLRDGNQALIEPMDRARKQRMFDTLVAIGFKEIEVGFPSASQADYDFVRQLIDNNAIPADVTIQVLTQAREDLIERTFEALQGASRAILHVYHATAPVMRRVVFNKSRTQVIDELARHHVAMIQELSTHYVSTDWTLQYSPEMFSNTELDFSKDIVDAVTEIWAPTPTNKCIINLPSTVETSTPNIFADMIEWMHRGLARRDALVLSVHPHNDRGTGTAAAELALMAGADRLEGCLFGNGERTGNLDLVNVALNLYTQGINPGLELSNIDEIRETVEHCNQLPVHPRHPYVGDLVYTSFSGSHQDAIKKTLNARSEDEYWEIPYLPIDPHDLNRSYQVVIRVNSQSGRGGMTYLLEADYGMFLPRRAQIEFAQAVQVVMDEGGGELNAAQIWNVLSDIFLTVESPIGGCNATVRDEPGDNGVNVDVSYQFGGAQQQRSGAGETVAHAILDALESHCETAVTMVSVAHHKAASADYVGNAYYVELRARNGLTRHGIGLGKNLNDAAAAAVCSGIGRLMQDA